MRPLYGKKQNKALELPYKLSYLFLKTAIDKKKNFLRIAMFPLKET